MASITLDIHVEGLARMDEILRRLPEEIAGPILEAALLAATEPVLSAARANIRRGPGRGNLHTAEALVAAVQVDPARYQGAAAIGAGKLTYRLRWLEFGTAAHDMTGGAEDARTARKALRALRRIGAGRAATTIKRGIASGAIGTRRALGVWPKGIPGIGFRAKVHHPGMRPQAPLTRALFTMSRAALDAFASRVWSGIQAAVKRVPGIAA